LVINYHDADHADVFRHLNVLSIRRPGNYWKEGEQRPVSTSCSTPIV
jgi:hypothetical protein